MTHQECITDSQANMSSDQDFLSQPLGVVYNEQLREQIDVLQNRRKELANPQSDNIKEHINKLSESFQHTYHETSNLDSTRKVTTTTQTVLDLNAFSLLTSINYERTQAIVTTLWGFRPDDYARRLAAFVNRNNETSSNASFITREGKTRLLEIICPYSQNLLTSWRPLLGSFEFSEEEEIAPRKRERQSRNIHSQSQDVIEVQPMTDNDLNSQQTESSTSSSLIVNVKKLLRYYISVYKGPISYYRFVVDPTSFSKTVENVFYVSFLIKGGQVSLLEDKNGLPVLDLTEKGPGQATPQTENDRSKKKQLQIIFNMNMDLWEELVEVLQLEKPMIRPIRSALPATS